MLVSLELGADSSWGCADREIGRLLFATHPHPAVREWLRAIAVFGNSYRSKSLAIATRSYTSYHLAGRRYRVVVPTGSKGQDRAVEDAYASRAANILAWESVCSYLK